MIVFAGDSYILQEGEHELRDYATIWGVDMELADAIANQGCMAILGCDKYNKWV